ncbi:MAG: phosphoglucosamine mutase [Gammaproteobacteria bacterium]
MNQHSHFGTDGIRGTVGEAPITVDFVLKLGWAVGRVLAQAGQAKVVIGKDTRVSGYMLEAALEAGLTAAGIDVYLLGPIPTPAIAYLTRELQAQAGVVISASHNPYPDNGIKLFSSLGEKISEAFEQEIERHLALPIVTLNAKLLGKAYRVDDVQARYRDFCLSLFKNLSLKGMKVVLDCANGATYHIAPELFTRLGAEVVTIGVSPNGRNINEGCGSTDLTLLKKTVQETKADVGIAFDGDGDRVLFVDAQGQAIDGDQLVYALAKYGHDKGTLKGGVVGTLMSNLGLEFALKDMGIPFERTSVGDKYVHAKLEEKGWTLGGESSGHVIQMQRHSTGDGILAALGVLEALIESKSTISAYVKGMTCFPQVMINVAVLCSQDPMLHPQIAQAVADVEAKLDGRGRVLLRRSGTEPVVRVMVEGEEGALVQSLAEGLATMVKEVLVSDKQHCML